MFVFYLVVLFLQVCESRWIVRSVGSDMLVWVGWIQLVGWFLFIHSSERKLPSVTCCVVSFVRKANLVYLNCCIAFVVVGGAGVMTPLTPWVILPSTSLVLSDICREKDKYLRIPCARVALRMSDRIEQHQLPLVAFSVAPILFCFLFSLLICHNKECLATKIIMPDDNRGVFGSHAYKGRKVKACYFFRFSVRKG